MGWSRGTSPPTAGAAVGGAYAEARRRGHEIVYPLTEEPWGLRRFFVRDPTATS